MAIIPQELLSQVLVFILKFRLGVDKLSTMDFRILMYGMVLEDILIALLGLITPTGLTSRTILELTTTGMLLEDTTPNLYAY